MATADPDFLDAAAKLVAYVPAGRDRDDLLRLLRLGVAFARQHVGRRRGFLHRYVAQMVGELGPSVTFEDLVAALQLAAARRDQDDQAPIEHVSRSFEVVKYCDPRRGLREVTFSTLRNVLTNAKAEKFPISRKP